MVKDDILKLRSCIKLLDSYEKPLRKDIESAGQMQEPPAVMLLRAFTFGHVTLKAMVAVVDQDEECGVCLPTLCRPFYELAARLLWASREQKGWQRLQRHYANETKKWASRAVRIAAWVEFAQPILYKVEEVLNRTDRCGKNYKQTPKIEDTLKKIEQHDIDCGIKTETRDFPLFEYTNLWLKMCHTAHGHIIQIARSPEEHAHNAIIGAVIATFALLRATAVVTARDQQELKQTVDTMVHQVSKILRGNG